MLSVHQKAHSSTEVSEQLTQTQPAAVKTEDKSTQTLSQEILNSLLPVIEEKLSGVGSDATLTLAQHKKHKQKQVEQFQLEAQNLRNDLVKLLVEAKLELAESEREHILSSLISSGVSTEQDYDQALQNISIPEEIKLFLNKNGRAYWDSLQKLKSLYLEEEIEISERQIKRIEAELRAHAHIKHTEAKLASEEVVKAAEV